jgi:CRISPR-associated protein Cas1
LVVVSPIDESEKTAPFDDIGALVLGTSHVSLTGDVLSVLAEAGGCAVVAGGNGLPVMLALPTSRHSLHGERADIQVGAALPLKKRLWQRIVKSKVKAQAALLRKIHGDDSGLDEMATRVASGDTSNIEARAARVYWGRIFAPHVFHRSPEGEPPNHLLNYGYAVLRAMTARAICSAGLVPVIGLHHCNRYDAFRLADDLMEPFRPMVDQAVFGITQDRGMATDLDKTAKSQLISPLLRRYTLEAESRTLFDVLSLLVASLVAVMDGKQTDICLPIPHALLEGE